MSPSGLISGLHYESHGTGDGPPLIFSAGLGGAGGYWRPNLAALADADRRLILYDHRGTGRSDPALPPTLSVDDMARDLLALVDGLGIDRVIVVGHAAGAAIALALALLAPARVAGLVLVNGFARPDPHFRRCFEARLALLRAGGPRAYLRAQPLFLFPAPWISAHDAELDAELEHQLAGFQGAANIEARIAALTAFDVHDRLAEVTAPVLCVAAKDDMLVPWTCSRDLAAALPEARLHLLPEGGHACNLTEPEAFNAALLDWLGGLPTQGAS